MEPISGSFVVLAQAFNPSILSESWLLERGVVKEGEFGETAVRMPQLAQHRIGAVDLLVVPERLQTTFSPDDLDAMGRATELVLGISRDLPHTPFTALGVNFHYGIRFRDETFPQAVRRMFLRDDCPLAAHFDAPDAHFGAYFSRDFEGARFKLDVKPVRLSAEAGSVPGLRFAFNLHRDVTEQGDLDAIQQIEDCLNAAPRCRELAVSMVSAVEASAGDALLPY